ncbi:hypothetical protein F5Y10DRAFT_290186 [Nemania abortiva]|nr:hypothetical protein F5Y10DRAFT_290186 [Nemania abortiva]
MAPPRIPEPTGPSSWTFYIVSEIAGQHRPLAVVQRYNDDDADDNDDGLDGQRLVALVRRILTILCDPVNRVAIESERALAVDFFCEYRTHEDEESSLPSSAYDGMSTSAFPFISTCLLLGVSEDTTYEHWLVSLSTIYLGADSYGMVVIDVTDLESPRYGIVALMARPTIEWNVSQSGGEWVDGKYAQEERSRQPLSATGYLEKFGPREIGDEALKLETIHLVDTAAMNLIWPQSGDPGSFDFFFTRVPLPPPSRSLCDQALTALISSTQEIETFEMSIFDAPRQIPGFQNLLRRMLHELPGRLGQSRAAGQLIGLALSGSQHLDLVRLQGLSAEAIRGALETEDLKTATSISLCLDTMVSTPTQIIDVLASAAGLRDMYFFQKPTREDDKLSTDIFLELSKRPHLFRRGRVFFSGAYSAALKGKFWIGSHGDMGPTILQPSSLQHYIFWDSWLRYNLNLYKILY